MKKIILVLFSIVLSCNLSCNAKNISVEYDEGIYHIVLSGEKIKRRIQFVSSNELITNREAHLKSGSLLTINAGFFDPKNKKTISYIVSDGEIVEDPIFNENLVTNPSLRGNLKKVLNRSEFRILDCDGKLKYEIASHNARTDFLCSIRTSAQGGPMLLPALRLEEEAFIQKDKNGDVVKESASVLHKTPRTLIGLKTLDNLEQEVHIFIVTNEHPIDIYEARDLCRFYKLDSAMAFDGGSSTSLNYKKINVISSQQQNDTGRALKSFMIIRKK